MAQRAWASSTRPPRVETHPVVLDGSGTPAADEDCLRFLLACHKHHRFAVIGTKKYKLRAGDRESGGGKPSKIQGGTEKREECSPSKIRGRLVKRLSVETSTEAV